MHRLLFSAAVLSLIALPSSAQPPWPETTLQSEIAPGQPSPEAVQVSRRITPRTTSGRPRETPQGSVAARGAPSPWTAFTSLAVVVGVILAAARLWRKHGPSIGGGLPADALEILGRRPLDRRTAIQIVRCGSRILILGVAEDGLRTLAEITDPAEVDDLLAICRRGESDQQSGPGLLGLLRRAPARTPTDESQYRGRIDEVLAERFPHSAPAAGTAGSPAHA